MVATGSAEWLDRGAATQGQEALLHGHLHHAGTP